ncbi:MAG: hypothetical protein ACO1RA_15340 [Planctomycetaceae bacterium]
MSHDVSVLLHKLGRMVNHMEMQHWGVVAVVAVFAGFMCLRGFSSQLNA